jgi:hypothetical protein
MLYCLAKALLQNYLAGAWALPLPAYNPICRIKPSSNRRSAL